jgi:hypothetical protein
VGAARVAKRTKMTTSRQFRPVEILDVVGLKKAKNPAKIAGFQGLWAR